MGCASCEIIDLIKRNVKSLLQYFCSNSATKPFIIQANKILSARQHNEHDEMKNGYIRVPLYNNTSSNQ